MKMAMATQDSGNSNVRNAWLEMSDPATVNSSGPPQEDQAFDFPVYEPGMFLRQFSEPATFSSAPEAPRGLPPGMRVKNTFLDYPVHTELDMLRWRAKPAKISVEPGQDRHMTPKAKLSCGEGDMSTNGSDSSHRAPSLTISVPDSPASKPTTPVDSPRKDPTLQAQEGCAALPRMQPEADLGFTGLTAYTVTIRGLPQECTTQVLTQELFDAGYKKNTDFDFLFVPRDVSTGCCLGCAFVNFKNHSSMRSFVAAFQGRTLRHVASHQALAVTISTFQDLLYVTGQRTCSISSSDQPISRYCTGCGWQVGPATFNFCPRCGTRVQG